MRFLIALLAFASITAKAQYTDLPLLTAGSLDSMSSIQDVNITSIADENILQYDAETLKWLNVINSVDNLNNVTITSKATGDVLQWNGSAWVDAVQTSQYIIHDTPSGETVEQMFDETINQGIFEAPTVTASGTTVSWTSGEMYDKDNNTIVETDAGSGSCTNNDITYLYWATGSTLTLSTTKGTGTNVNIATIGCQDGARTSLHTNEALSTREHSLIEAMESLAPTLVTSGLIVSEDTDATNVWDVVSTAGVYWLDAHKKETVVQINSRTTPMVRHFHTAGVWDSDTNAQIDIANYDNGTNLVARTSSKYQKSCFWIDGGTIHWVYPRVEYTLVSDAIAAACPAEPPGLENLVRVTAVVNRASDGAFPAVGSNRWIDIRPILGVIGSNPVSDHLNLSSLTSGDAGHTQFPLLIGRATGQTLIGGTASGDDLTLQSTSNATKGNVIVSETTTSTTKDTGALIVEGGVGIEENVNVGGTLSVAGSTTTNGVFSELQIKDNDYSIGATDNIILADATSNSVDITLPDVVSGRTIIVKAINVANTIRILPEGAGTIDGEASITFTSQYESYTLVSDGSDWFITSVAQAVLR